MGVSGQASRQQDRQTEALMRFWMLYRERDVHLFPAEDQTLLDRWDALFFLDLLFDLRHLHVLSAPADASRGREVRIYLVIWLDVKLDLFPR